MAALTAHYRRSEVRGAAPQFAQQGGLGLYHAAFRSKALRQGADTSLRIYGWR